MSQRSRRGCPVATMELMEELQIIKTKSDQAFFEKAPLNYSLRLIDFYYTLQEDEKRFILFQELLHTLHELNMTDRWFLWNNHIQVIVNEDYKLHESSIAKWSCHSEDNGDGRILSCPVLCEIWRSKALKVGDDNFHLQGKCTCVSAA
jgi:hypothetical protein